MAKKKPTKKPSKIKEKPKKVVKSYATIEKAAAHCGVGITTFRNYMTKYPDLPIESKNATGKGYQIDLEKLDLWREKNNLLNWTPITLTGEGEEAVRRPQATKDRKAQIQTDLLQIELDEKMGKLIPRDDVVKALSTKIAQTAKRFDLLPAWVGRRAGMTPEAIELMRKYLDETRIAFAQDNDGFFTAIEKENEAGDEQLL